MFQFAPLASVGLCIHPRMTTHDGRRVSPFGHHRITACVRLPDAFRSLPRPSRLSVPRHPPCALVRLTGNARSRRPSINRVAPRCTPAPIYTISLGLRSRFRQKTTTTHREVISASDSHSSTTHTQNPKSVSIPEGTKAPPGALLDPYFTQPSTQVVKQQPSRRTRERRFATTCDL
jgi:hypothetical protein